jgi:transposase
MEMELFWFDDKSWRAIVPLLPSRQTGPKRSDDRAIISGIVYVLISGCAWRDCPSAYGPAMTVFNRFNRWKHRGLWKRIYTTLMDPMLSTLSPRQRDALHAAQVARSQVAKPRLAKEAAQMSVYQAWDEAAMQLQKIARVHQGRPLTAWIDSVVEWHMDALFANMECNTPRNGVVTAEFAAQIASLRSDIVTLVTSLRAYIDEPHRNLAPVRRQLARLELSLKQATFASVGTCSAS